MQVATLVHNSADLSRLDWPPLKPVYVHLLIFSFGVCPIVQNRLEWPPLKPVYVQTHLLIFSGVCPFVNNRAEWSTTVFMFQDLTPYPPYQTYQTQCNAQK